MKSLRRSKFLFASFASLLGLLVTSAAHAHVYHYGVTIKNLIQWEASSYVIISLSNNASCHLAPEDKQMYPLVLLLYSTDGRADIVCHDLAENVNGFLDVHKLHRVIAVK